MTSPFSVRLQFIVVGLCAFLFREVAAQNQPSYLQLSPTVKAVLYSPSPSSTARVAVVNMHEDGNRLSDIACTELVKRGFYVLCMNGRSDNNEALDFWNDLPIDVATGVKYLRETLKVPKVLLYGGSGGAPLMTFYQNVAQNGPSVCQGATKLIPCTKELAGLPSADGIILRDAHPGTAVNTLRSINPSLQRDDKPDQVIASLDPFNAKNGFNASGSRDFLSLPRPIRRRVRRRITILRRDPRAEPATLLWGEWEGYWRLRVGEPSRAGFTCGVMSLAIGR